MSSLLKDHLPNVSAGAISDNYVAIGDYQLNQIPQSSLLKLSVSAGNEKYFSTAPAFEQRTDSTRIPPPRLIPVSVSADNGLVQNVQQALKLDHQAQVSSDYYTLESGAYKMSPM